MDDMGKRTQDWKDRNPFIVWRKTQGFDSRQAAEKLSIPEERFFTLEVGNAPSNKEWLTITKQTGITEAQWKSWLMSKPHVGVEPPKP